MYSRPAASSIGRCLGREESLRFWTPLHVGHLATEKGGANGASMAESTGFPICKSLWRLMSPLTFLYSWPGPYVTISGDGSP
jgi:hypothetical protein